MSRQQSMDYTKRQIDNYLNEFNQKFNHISKQIEDIINSDASPTGKITILLSLIKNIDNSLDIVTLMNLCASYEFNYGCLYDSKEESKS